MFFYISPNTQRKGIQSELEITFSSLMCSQLEAILEDAYTHRNSIYRLRYPKPWARHWEPAAKATFLLHRVVLVQTHIWLYQQGTVYCCSEILCEMMEITMMVITIMRKIIIYTNRVTVIAVPSELTNRNLIILMNEVGYLWFEKLKSLYMPVNLYFLKEDNMLMQKNKRREPD